MRIPDPIANTTTEAYLAYKAGVLSEGDLKPKLYDPYIHLDAWLAYWAGLVATYPVDKNNDPEMLTDEEALIAYLSGVTNTYPEEFRDPADVRVAAYLKYLVSARWGRPEYPVTNEELYLSMMDAPYIPAGEPSSDIEIDDTAEAPFRDVKMYGDTSQTTYTGKNLLKMPIVSNSSNGITWTVQDDGSIILNGTSTDSVGIRANNVTIPAVEGETYTLSATGMGEAYNFGYKNSDSGANIFVVTSTSPTTTAVVTSKMLSQANRLDMYIQSGKTFNNQRVTLQLEKGSTATSYEPYVGGVPSPNPDYPQVVQTVTGENVVKICGKNLWGAEEHGSINENTGEDVWNANRWRTVGYIPVKSNTAYTLSSNASADIWHIFCFYDSGKNFISGVAVCGGSQTQTTPANCKFMRCVICDTASIKTTERQLEKGSTPTEFIPYQSGEYEINLGKNLYDKSSADYNVYLGTESVAVNAQGNGWSIAIPVEVGQTYTFSRQITTGQASDTNYAFIGSVPASGVAYIGGRQSLGTGTTFTATAPSGAKYLIVYYAWNSPATQRAVAKDTFQIELGSTPTSYAPYFTPIELCKIGVYRDYIYEDEGEWKIRSRIVKTKLVSTIDGWSISSFDTQKRLYIPSQNAYGVQVVYGASNDDPNPQVCSHFTNISATDLLAGETGIAISSSGYLSIRDNNQANAQDFKDWLDENEPVAYAVRANPTDILITNTALIEQLNALKAGGSYNGKTYIKITATDPNLPGLLKVEAYKYD